MPPSSPVRRLILRVVLREVSPMVIRVLSVPDDTELTDPHEIFQVLMDLMRAKKRRGFGWKRRSRAWLYTTLGLYQDYRIRPVGHA